MNTERPDNDDEATESGGAGTADAPEAGARGSADAGASAKAEASAGAAESAGADKAGGSEEAGDAEEAGGAAEARGSEEAGESDEAASEAPGDSDETADASDKAEGSDSAADASDKAVESSKPAAASATSPDGTPVSQAEPTGDDTAGDDAAPDNPPASDSDLPRGHEVLVGHGGGRSRTPAIIASVAAAVLLIGGGGAWLAANASGGSGGGTTSGAPGGDGTPPPLALDGYSEGGGNGIAPGEPNPYGATYRVDGTLPGGPGEAPVYRVRGEVTKEAVARLAKALGVEGTPVVQGEAWKVGAGRDGSGPSLSVNREAPGTWTFSRYAPGTDNCKGTDACTAPGSGGTPVSEAAAKQAAAPVLKAVGQDDAKQDASQVMGAQRVVNAAPEVGGLPTHGWTTGVTVGSDGEVVGGSGRLAVPVKGDTYPVVSARKALELMNERPKTDHRMGIGGCASAVPHKDRLEQPCGSSPSGAPEQDAVTVENAVFGLAAHFVDGRQALVPSWLFEVTAPGAKDPFTVTYPAVDPKYLTSPAPSGPGDRPTGAPEPRDVKVDGYRAEGSELTVTFTGGVCADYDVKASERGDEVTVTVTSTPWPDKVCIMIAKQFQETVRLDEPLGDRKVVDEDGKAVPLAKEGARLPAPPTRSR